MRLIFGVWTDCAMTISGLCSLETSHTSIRMIWHDVLLFLDGFTSFKILNVNRSKVNKARLIDVKARK